MWLQRLTGLAARRVPPTVFSIDATGLAAGRFRSGEERRELVEHRRVPVPEDLFLEGPLGGVPASASALETTVEELLAELSQRPTEGSLVVPDAWLRVAFVDLDELPRRRHERQEVLRWKLRGLVPFRVEDLRVEAVASRPLPRQEERHRFLVGFLLERLAAALEAAFAARGVGLGQIVNESLAVARLLPLPSADGVSALVYVRDGEVSQMFGWDGDLVFHRHKRLTREGASPESVRRDLLLTRSFLEDALPEEPVRRVWLLADRGDRPTWSQWLADAFGTSIEELGPEDVALARQATEGGWLGLVPLVGGALGERL